VRRANLQTNDTICKKQTQLFGNADDIAIIGRSQADALRMPNWNRNLPFPPYSQRCRLLDLDTLEDRRRISCAPLISDVLCGKLDCPKILCNVKLVVPFYNTRNRMLLAEVSHRTNYGQNEPLNRMIRTFNEFSEDFEFGASRYAMRENIRRRIS
jgi:hypothetical protein